MTLAHLLHLPPLVDGFTDLKILRDGSFWVTHVSEFCNKNGLSTDVESVASQSDSDIICDLPHNSQLTYDKFHRRKMSIEQVAADRYV